MQVEPNFDRALEFYSNASELDPLNKEALQLKGLLLKKLQKMQESEAALKQAFKLDPDDAELEILLQEVMISNRQVDSSNQVQVSVTAHDVEIKCMQ